MVLSARKQPRTGELAAPVSIDQKNPKVQNLMSYLTSNKKKKN
jgi:hypothetical protein